jgi:hypothetical protein
MMQEIVNAHIAQMNALGRTIEHRVAFENISRIERAQRALKSAGRKMSGLSSLSTRTN